MKDIFAAVGALIMLFCTVPYIADIVKGKTKPNIVTWFTWTLLLSVGTAALFAAQQPHAALLLLGDTAGTFAVVLFGLKYGIAKLDLLDGLCQLGALIGLALWLLFDSPMIAIIATIAIDLIGTIPTLRHSWSAPEEETVITFILGVVATIFTLVSLKSFEVSAWVYPAYLLLSNSLLVATIEHGKHLTISRSIKRASVV